MKMFLKIFLVFFGILIAINLGILDWVIIKSNIKYQISKPIVEEIAVKDKIATGSCEPACQNLIEEKISISPPVVPKIKTPTLVNGKPKIVYMPLVAIGEIASVDWTDIVPSEFYFNLTDYPNVKEVRFEAYLSSSNADQVFARIYDATNKRGVDYSDLLTANNAFTRIESSPIKIWAGNNKYTVQLRSVNGTDVLLKDAKLKITY